MILKFKRYEKKKFRGILTKLLFFIQISVFYFFSASAIFMARTFVESPKRLMNPSASW